MGSNKHMDGLALLATEETQGGPGSEPQDVTGGATTPAAVVGGS